MKEAKTRMREAKRQEEYISFSNEKSDLITYIETLGESYESQLSEERKKEFGQYLTPKAVAEFMGGLFDLNIGDENKISILDPGAGVGILSCALLEIIHKSEVQIDEVELVAFELDEEIIPYLNKSYEYARSRLKDRGIELSYNIKDEDFILSNSEALGPRDLFKENNIQKFDFIIMNPPYFKIRKNDPRAQAVSSIVYGQPNIYALFMAVGAYLLKPKGQMVSITPRSFTAGKYFEAFRNKFFEIARPEFIHLFDSREDVFEKNAVLQENVILKVQREHNWKENQSTYQVKTSLSHGMKDLDNPEIRKNKSKDIIDMSTDRKIIHIPTSDREEEIIKLVHSWDNKLEDYNMQISTGPVVAFRNKEVIKDKGEISKECAPLFWMQHVDFMSIDWPLPLEKRDRQYLEVSEKSNPILISDSNYVLLKRFTSKDEKRRLVAAPYLPGKFEFESDYIGLENHLNYIHRPNGKLSKEEVYGLAALYNSKLLDVYFRTFNGNTQVNATQMRNIPLPKLNVIKEIGHKIMKDNKVDIDKYVKRVLMEKENKIPAAN